MGDSKVAIQSIDKGSPLLAKVIELWGQNRELGFFPKGAFEAHAERRQILVALKNGRLAGYVLYRISRNRASIVHFCIAKEFRGQKIPEDFFAELQRLTSDLDGIGLWCRRDYSHAVTLWERLGFKPRSDKPGRGKDGEHLTFWWFDYNQPNLFSGLAPRTDPQIPHVVIDTNIFLELQEESAPLTEDSYALSADWLRDEIALAVTPEIHIEIHRNNDPQRKKAYRESLSDFDETKDLDGEFDKHLRAVGGALPEAKTDQDRSDRKHLAHCASAGIQTFVTKDVELLKNANRIHKSVGVTVTDPATFIIGFDERHHPEDYQPSRLAGTHIRSSRLLSADISKFSSSLQVSKHETLKQFSNWVKKLALQALCEVHVIRDGDRICGGYAFARHDDLVLNIPLLRFPDDKLASTLARHLINRATLRAAREGRKFVLVTDTALSAGTSAALAAEGFRPHSQSWAKATLLGTHIPRTISALLRDARFPGLQISSKELKRTSRDWGYAFAAEKQLWPAKISNSRLPCYIISIKPGWAERLFDENLASETFLGTEISLTLNCEAIYYRSSRVGRLASPGRILWYVSKGGKFSSTSQIRAASLLSAIDIDEATVLYRKYNALGIYQWPDVLKAAKGNAHALLMAMRFSNTECLNHPVDFHTATAVLKKYGIRSTFLSPTPIPESAYLELYGLGS